MAGRPQIPIGEHGVITTRVHARDEHGNPTAHQARTRYRDTDGVTRQVSALGPSKTAATRALTQAMRHRNQGCKFTSETRVEEAAESWLTAFARQIDAGSRSPSSGRIYRMSWENHLRPRLGTLRLREATVTRCNEALVAITDEVGSATAKTARAALSGIMGHAVVHGGLDTNPVRECAVIESRRTRAPRAMTAAEREDWLAKMEADAAAARRDVPDLTRMLLATGCRIAEILAVTFDDVDLTAGAVTIDWQITAVTGKGLVRRTTKTKFGERTLLLPSWAISMIRRRKLRYGPGPLFPHAAARRNPALHHAEAFRDPSNTSRDFREARDEAGYGWVTSHVFRKTVASVLDDAGLRPRQVADQLGQSRVSITTDVYMGRKATNEQAAAALEAINPDTA